MDAHELDMEFYMERRRRTRRLRFIAAIVAIALVALTVLSSTFNVIDMPSTPTPDTEPVYLAQAAWPGHLFFPGAAPNRSAY